MAEWLTGRVEWLVWRSRRKGCSIDVVFVVVVVLVIVDVVIAVISLSGREEKDQSGCLFFLFKGLIVPVGCACCKRTLRA